jgi:hypothetical protein
MKLVMRTICLMMLFALSDSALAEWVKVHGSEIQTTYANAATIDATSDRIKMWLVTDYMKPHKYDGKPFLSVMSQNEYDCGDAQVRMLSYSLHAGNMGKGEVVYSDPSKAVWKSAATGSADEISWKIVCDLSAGWVKVGENEVMSGYANPFSIRKKGERAEIWELFEFKSAREYAGKQKFISIKLHAEYNCKENQFRTLSLAYHPKSMGGGDQVFADTKTQKWEPVATGTDTVLRKIACGTR